MECPKPTYHEVTPIERSEAEAIFASASTARICDALVRSTYFDPDWRWVEMQCLHLLERNEAALKKIAMTCLGNLAEFHRCIDHELVVPRLQEMLKIPEFEGGATVALEDIGQFAPRDAH
jgi:hypothetical protein